MVSGAPGHVRNNLASYKPSIPADLDIYDDLIFVLVGKASGVFLWVRLATRSVIEGIRNGDSWTTLHKRTEELEPGIDRLFKQMWERQNHNRRLYKEETARLLWYTIYVDNMRNTVSTKQRGLVGDILGTNPSLSSSILSSIANANSNSNRMKAIDEERIFIEHEKWLSARSAGFLEIYKSYSHEMLLLTKSQG